MKPWMEDFIHLCLAKIPDLLYRKRLTAELSDHLASLSEDLEAEGLPAGQAQALALERMGDPEVLSAAYLAQWRQRMNTPRYRPPSPAVSAVLCLLRRPDVWAWGTVYCQHLQLRNHPTRLLGDCVPSAGPGSPCRSHDRRVYPAAGISSDSAAGSMPPCRCCPFCAG